MKRKTKSKISLFLTIIITIYSIFVPLMDVKADGSYQAKLTSDVNLRSKPTTDNNSDSSNNIIDILNMGFVVTVLSSTTVAGNGCDDGWLNVSYEGQTGYICSKYVTTDLSNIFDFPWSTPKKAIIGGAKYIAYDYIRVGQFTTYLKKFNVNPNSEYDLYNHQYQTNVMAPFTEGGQMQRAYWNANMNDLSFTFNIPIYENMADSYTCASCQHASPETNTDKIDSAFETEMTKQGFPDSYKPALRSLHYEHPNWKFVGMKTGLNFEDVINKETGVNVIQINNLNSSSSSLCLDSPCTGIGNSWYYASREVVSYYMDPRNVLNESYVFQFNSLEYADFYTESLLNNTLKNTFMEGMDFIDNQSYSSIFVEAGKTANINPLYLVALAIQENGTSVSIATSGEKFDYKNKTYSGLFNFFNIGAKDKDNWVKNGLKYASGGFCTTCANYSGSNQTNGNNTTNIVSHNTSASNINVSFSGNYVKGFVIGTLINDLRNRDGNISYDVSDIITTGAKLTFADGTSFTAVVYGDINGDGKINSADLLKMRQYLLGQTSLDGAFNEAANIAGNGTINSANLLKLRQYLLGNSDISQG